MGGQVEGGPTLAQGRGVGRHRVEHRAAPVALPVQQRSTGMIGSLFKLITLGAVHAMRDGIEELTREVLDEIDIDVAAEDAREIVAKELEEMKRAAAKRSTTRAIA